MSGSYEREKQKKCLIVAPLFGLANRLRVVASASIISDLTHRKLFLDWKADETCGARWSDLFENHIPEYKCESDQVVRCYENKINNFESPGPGDLVYDSANIIKVKTCFNFKPPWMAMDSYFEKKSQFYRRLIPVEPVRKTLEELKKKYFINNRVVGVHIRRADFMLAGAPPHFVSPTDLFIERIRQLIKIHPSAIFFLSTDDLKEQRVFLDEFKEKVFCAPKREVRRNDVAGIREALVDWIALSESCLILRSAGTSFSREAALVNQIPRETIKRPFWPYNRYRYWKEAFRRQLHLFKKRHFGPIIQ